MLLKLPKETQDFLARLPAEHRQPQLANILKSAAAQAAANSASASGSSTPQLQANMQIQQRQAALQAQAQAQAQAQGQMQGQVQMQTPQMRQALPPGGMNMMNLNPHQQAHAQGQPSALMQQIGAHMQAMQQGIQNMQNPGMHQRTPSDAGQGAGGPVISQEMYNSFMQRNTGATGGM